MSNQSVLKNKQAVREAKSTLFVYALYFLFSVLTAYILGADVDNYTYILGFPAWFFFSCILGYPLACIGVYLLIKKVFMQKEGSHE